jgi:hypothetical protein
MAPVGSATLIARARHLVMRTDAIGTNYLSLATNLLTLVQIVRGRDDAVSTALQRRIHNAIESGSHSDPSLISALSGIARGLLNDLEAGFLPDFTMRIRSDVEGDLLAQAHRLLEEDHLKDPAAMLVGAVLEDALRQLCRKHGVAEGDGIEKMNVPLRQAGAYGLPQGQQITAWAAIRNKADHARFADYTDSEVRVMHQGVAGFIAAYLV